MGKIYSNWFSYKWHEDFGFSGTLIFLLGAGLIWDLVTMWVSREGFYPYALQFMFPLSVLVVLGTYFTDKKKKNWPQ